MFLRANPFNRSKWNSRIKFRVDDGDEGLVDKPGTLLLPMQRDGLIRYLPSGGHIAEIGVARGHFSAKLSAVCKPSLLVLVDPWCEQDQTIYYGDSNNAPQTDQEKRYRTVSRQFQSTAPGKECRVVRKFSADAVKEFADGFFDWVFIDGNHSHEACLEDLQLWAPKVKADGLICGHDFAVHASARQAKYGVVSAVQEYVAQSGNLLAALTIEQFPTFVIAKTPHGEILQRFRRLLFSHESHLIQVANGDRAHFEHARVLDNGKPRSAFVALDFSSNLPPAKS